MERNAEYYKKRFNLQPVKCNGFLSLVYEYPPHFNFAYYLIEEGTICPWHKMGTFETCHFIDGDPIGIYVMEEREGLMYPRKIILSRDKLDYFIEPGTWCTFFLPKASKWSFISHFHIAAYNEAQSQYATENEFLKLFPKYPRLAKKYGLKGFYNKNL